MLSIGSIVGDDPNKVLEYFPTIFIKGDYGQVYRRHSFEARPYERRERQQQESSLRTNADDLKGISRLHRN
jgi:hypothetical protein